MSYAISNDAIIGDDMEMALRKMLLEICDGIEGISISFLEQIKEYFPSVWLIIEDFTKKILTNLGFIYQKGMSLNAFKIFNISLLTELDGHFVMSIMTNSEAFRNQGMSLNDLVKEYLQLRLAALKS